MDTVGEGEGEMNWESSIEMYALPYVKWMVHRNWLYDTVSSNPVL